MKINSRFLRSVDVSSSFIGVGKRAFLVMLTIAVGGCAGTLRESNVDQPPLTYTVDTKMRPGEASSSIATTIVVDGSLVSPQPISIAASAAPPVAGTDAPRETSRTYVGTGNFINQRPPTPSSPSGPEEFALNFEALDIRQIVQYILGDYLREFFTIHPQTTGNATIRTSKPVSRQDLLPILEMLLRQNGQVMVKEEGMYKIMPAALGTRGSVSPALGGTTKPLPNGYSVQIIQLKFVGVADMARILAPYQVDATSVQQDALRNLLIISGTQR